MVPAPVGFQCVECVHRSPSRAISARSLLAGRRPYVTYVLVGINVAVFLAGPTLSLIATGDGGISLAQLGGLDGPDVVRGQWWRLVTSGFLHANILHITFNMIALFVLGQIMESALGRPAFAVLYFTSLLAGSLGALLRTPDALTVGASGAIFGLMGAAVVGERSMRIGVAGGSMMVWLVLNLVFTVTIPGISIGGHLGGLAGGLICGVLLFGLRGWRPNRGAALAGCVLLGAACAAASLWWVGRLTIPSF